MLENKEDKPIFTEEIPVHHKQLELCTTRAAYRQGRNLTSVKVYTIGFESQHLFIYNVPKINLRPELKSLCTRYGKIKTLAAVTVFETEKFTECFHVHYERIQSARIAKRFLDNKSFYGGVLHVCYAPERESVDETRAKIKHRLFDVKRRINTLSKEETVKDNHKRSYDKMNEDPDPILQVSRNDMYKITNLDKNYSTTSYSSNDRNYSSNQEVSGEPEKNFKRPRFSQENLSKEEYGPKLPEGFNKSNQNTFGLCNDSDDPAVIKEISVRSNKLKRIVFRK